MLRHLIRILCCSTLLLGSAACGKVAVYERGRLAHRTMNPDDAASLGAEHVYAVHEGAVGGTAGAYRGCGCN